MFLILMKEHRNGKHPHGDMFGWRARKPSESLDAEPSFSRGWSTGDSKFTASDNLSPNDWKNYRNGNGERISSITVDISKDQFDKLLTYPSLAASGKIKGFVKNYDAVENSCIDFSGKGIGFIGLADKNFDGSGLFWARPDKQVNAFLEQIAEHRRKGAALVVEHRGRSYTFEENERDVKKFWRTIDPYWYLAQDENQREQPYQYAQTDIANRPCVSKICRNTPKTSTIRAKNVSLIFVDMKTSTIVRKIWTGLACPWRQQVTHKGCAAYR